jgi:hypothetical protein
MTDEYYYITAAGNSINSQLCSVQLLSVSGQTVRFGGKDRRYGQSITHKIPPVGQLSSSQPDGPLCWVSPLAFDLVLYKSNALVLFFCHLLHGMFTWCNTILSLWTASDFERISHYIHAAVFGYLHLHLFNVQQCIVLFCTIRYAL